MYGLRLDQFFNLEGVHIVGFRLAGYVFNTRVKNSKNYLNQLNIFHQKSFFDFFFFIRLGLGGD